MAIDSAAKRKAVLAISLYSLSPVVVPDSSISTFDRQVAGYGYGGITAGSPVSAEFITLENAALTRPVATAVHTRPNATATLTRPYATATQQPG